MAPNGKGLRLQLTRLEGGAYLRRDSQCPQTSMPQVNTGGSRIL